MDSRESQARGWRSRRRSSSISSCRSVRRTRCTRPGTSSRPSCRTARSSCSRSPASFGSERHRARTPGLWLLFASAVAVALVFFPQERFRIPVIDPTLILCAAGLWRTAPMTTQRARRGFAVHKNAPHRRHGRDVIPAICGRRSRQFHGADRKARCGARPRRASRGPVASIDHRRPSEDGVVVPLLPVRAGCPLSTCSAMPPA